MRIQHPCLAAVLGLSLSFSAGAVTHYVDLNGTNATSPFTAWSTAATNIQDAIDAAAAGDSVLVTNGVYRTGSRLVGGLSIPARVAVTQSLTLQSVNGPAVTVIEGYQVPGITNGSSAIRCVYLINGAVLSGFTITNGATGSTTDSGGGIYCQTVSHTSTIVSNCVVTGNSAGGSGGGVSGGAKFINCAISNNYARQYAGGAAASVLVACIVKGNVAGGQGGGSLQCLLTNCILVGNSVRDSGFGSGGASYGDKLVNCTVVSNSVVNGNGGGIGNASLVVNCIVYYNDAASGPNYFDAAPMVYSCTTPASSGSGNITNAPLLADLAGGNYHLQTNSPCINAGTNSYIKNDSDLDGNPRVVDGTVDMGAYEVQPPGSFPAWLLQYGLPADGSANYTDPDGDGMNNWQEWVAGTDPTNALSLLTILSISNLAPGLQITWQSISGKNYFLQRGTNLAFQPAFYTLASNIVGQAVTTVYNDTTTSNSQPYFYRVGIQ